MPPRPCLYLRWRRFAGRNSPGARIPAHFARDQPAVHLVLAVLGETIKPVATMSKINPAAMLAAVFMLASQAGAQNPPPAQGAAPPEPVIHTKVNEVALDLVVRDKKGRLEIGRASCRARV